VLELKDKLDDMASTICGGMPRRGRDDASPLWSPRLCTAAAQKAIETAIERIRCRNDFETLFVRHGSDAVGVDSGRLVRFERREFRK